MNDDSNSELDSPDFSQCSKCDYRDGFHIVFKPNKNGKTELVFICPSCHSRFDTGWIININK